MLNITSNTESTKAHIIILYFDFGRDYSFLTMCDLCRLLTISIFNNETLQINKNADAGDRCCLLVRSPATYSSSLIFCCCAHSRFPICSKIKLNVYVTAAQGTQDCKVKEQFTFCMGFLSRLFLRTVFFRYQGVILSDFKQKLLFS